MPQLRRLLLPIAAGAAVAGAVLSAPVAAAAPDCQTTGGSAVTGGQTTECVSPGNAEITTTPQVFPNNNDGVMYGFPGWGFGII